MRKTDFCPRSMTELENATKALGCSSDIYGNNQYMCLPNAEKTSLVEFCFDGLMGMKEKGKKKRARVIIRFLSHFLHDF